MAKLKRQRPLYHLFHYDERDLGRGLSVKCSPAKVPVVLHREAVDVLTSRAGSTIGCTNSNCAIRLGEAAFGHKVYLAEFTKTSVYVVDQLDRNRQPKHCIWYQHYDGAAVDLNDHIVDREMLLRVMDIDRPVILRPPVIRLGQPKSPPHAQGPRDVQTPRRQPVAHGALRRAMEAGLLILPTKK